MADKGDVPQGRGGAEKILGRTSDFVGVAFLDLARAAANAVVRIVSEELRPQATGFMISNRLMITNNHVIASPEEARANRIEFNYELGVDKRPRALTRFALDPESFFITNEQDDLDYTVVAVGAREDGAVDPSALGSCPLSAASDKHVLGEFVNIIEHPDGDYKQAVLRENQLVARDDYVLQYAADTNPGSSGSPVFNDQWEAVALHHWGGPHRMVADEQGRPVTDEVNEGIRISAIVKDLQKKRASLPAPAQVLLDAALNVASRAPTDPTIPIPTGGETMDARRNGSTNSQHPLVQGDAARWVIPLEISVRLGGEASFATPAPAAASSAPAVSVPGSERITVDRHYDNRAGYDPDFLPGAPLPLPSISDALRDDVVSLQGGDGFELKYEHFSVVMSASRRMAFFSIANIDGATWKDINRKTGAVGTSESLGTIEDSGDPEGGETWYVDSRIPADKQAAQSLYDGQEPRAFDRGHLTRRQDPCWGSATRAKRANADTFHFTNCTPQHFSFNESAKYWQGIEQYVLDNTTAEHEKVTVITGPVFADGDPPYRDVRVPINFWKIVARVEDGQLAATGLMASQKALIDQTGIPEKIGAETFADLGAVAQYQVSIAEIERRTGLGFDTLRDHDTYGRAPEAASAPIRSFEEIRLAPVRRGAAVI